MEHTIAFPGLGIGPFELNRVAFTVFGFDIYWYAVMITLGLIMAASFGFYMCKRFSMKKEDLVDGLLIILPLSVIGARLFFVIFNHQDYKTFWDVINIRDGGLGIWGALLVAFPAAVIFCRIKKLNIFSVLDLVAMGFLIGQSIGRWGNFFNAEVYGVATDLPWGMSINGGAPVHPLFLYESLINALGFVLAVLIYKYFKKRMAGDIALFYITWYGLFRGLLEMLRPSQYVLYIGDSGIMTAVVLGFACAAAGITVFAVRHFVMKKKELPDEFYGEKTIETSEGDEVGAEAAEAETEDEKENENGSDN